MRLLVFAGTTEGRELLETLLARGGTQVTACVATEYGAGLLPKHSGLSVRVGRLDEGEMLAFFRETPFSYVIDATHPYAVQATENIRRACAAAQIPYLRLLREPGRIPQGVLTENAEKAAEFLNTVEGNVLLTTGSKELAAFTAVQGYPERLFVRVLPVPDVLVQCQQLGFSGRHILAMQGPFSEELNFAMLRQVEAKWMVTKESGTAGGFAEKCRAARRAGAQVVLIGRPNEPEGGYSQTQILEKLFPEQKQESVVEKYFPMFVPLAGKQVVVFGGGTVAKRRVQTLLQFGCRITVVSPENSIGEPPGVRWTARGYEPGDVCGACLVLAATDCRQTNHAIFEECRKRNIPVNVADCKEECDFYFPAVLHRGPVVIGVTASGADHTAAARTAAQLREMQDTVFGDGKEQYHAADDTYREPGK